MGLKVLIAEANELFRAGLYSILITETRVSHIHEVTNEQDLKRQLQHASFDLIMVNQSMLSDLAVLRTTNFVMLAAKPDMTLLKSAYKHGARGYVSTNISAEFLRAVLRLDENAFWIEPTMVPLMIECIFDQTSSAVREEMLTPREREVFYLLREGHNRPSIARQLSITETTLKTHIKNIAKKRNLYPEHITSSKLARCSPLLR